ncbi:type VI-B CRISPR accessory protein Csx27 [Lacinutrix chionoecetis]
MDKFSLYDFMSFFMPGVLALYIGFHFIPKQWVVFNTISEFVSGLMFTLLAIVIGLIIHRITNFLLYDIEAKWFTALVRKPIDKIAIDDVKYIKPNFDNIMQNYNRKNLSGIEMFSEAYFFLEYQDKISTVKSFQSMHFFLRNIIIIQLISMPFFIAFLIADYQFKIALEMLVLTILTFPLVLWTSRFFRKKMVERVFNTFYVAMKYKNNKE